MAVSIPIGAVDRSRFVAANENRNITQLTNLAGASWHYSTLQMPSRTELRPAVILSPKNGNSYSSLRSSSVNSFQALFFIPLSGIYLIHPYSRHTHPSFHPLVKTAL